MKFRLCILLWAVAAASVHAQSYPARVVRVVVAYPAGGSIDTVARLAGQRFADSLGQQFIIDNRAGASGNIGTDFVAKAAPDGYTLLMGSAAAIASAPNMYAKLPYNPVRDFAPIVLIANQPNVLVVHPSIPVTNVKEFIALVKANPGKFNYGSSGVGSSQHMTTELFAMMTGAKMVHVPYKGGAPATADLLGGQIEFMFDTAPTAVQLIKGGRVRALAVTSLQRSKVLPALPTMDEVGLKGFELRGWIGLLAPAGTPREIIDRLNAGVQKQLAGDLNQRLFDLGLDVAGGTPAQFAAFIKDDIAKYGRIMQAAGIPQQ